MLCLCCGTDEKCKRFSMPFHSVGIYVDTFIYLFFLLLLFFCCFFFVSVAKQTHSHMFAVKFIGTQFFFICFQSFPCFLFGTSHFSLSRFFPHIYFGAVFLIYCICFLNIFSFRLWIISRIIILCNNHK